MMLAGLATSAAVAAPGDPAKALVPVPAATVSLMSAKDMDVAAPILIRSFKKESELEVWKLARSGRYVLLKTYPICRWSGQLGPKTATGDRQAPEGFYAVGARQMNPNSAYHLSFDLGYPNAYDRAHGGTGSYLMVHGTCSSMGCYAMTDTQISEIFALARDAFAAGQRAFQFQAYPFRMNAQNLARARKDRHYDFWRQLKEGHDRFEATGEEPAVSVAGGRYAFAPSRSPVREASAQAKIAGERQALDALVADGVAAVRVTYADGGQHAAYASLTRRGVDVGPVSRPEALALAGREIIIEPARRKTPLPPPSLIARAAPTSPGFGQASGGVATLFAPASLGADLSGTAPAVMAGSARILPASFAPRIVVADRRA